MFCNLQKFISFSTDLEIENFWCQKDFTWNQFWRIQNFLQTRICNILWTIHQVDFTWNLNDKNFWIFTLCKAFSSVLPTLSKEFLLIQFNTVYSNFTSKLGFLNFFHDFFFRELYSCYYLISKVKSTSWLMKN